MNCLNREQLFAYAHRLAEGRDEEAIREHVETCARCRAALNEYRQLDALLDEWKPAEPSPWFDARVRQAIAATEPGKPLCGTAWMRWAAVGALAVLMGVGVWAWRRAHQPVEVNPTVAHEVAPQKNPAQPPVTVAQSKPTAHPLPKAQEQAKQIAAPSSELNPDDDLKALEDYDLIANFDVLSEIPRGGTKVDN